MDLFKISLISFVFVATFSLAIQRAYEEPEVVNIAPVRQLQANGSYSDLPVLIGSEPFPVLSAQSVLVVDTKSGATLYEKNPDHPLLPASTTKIVTALVALDTYKMQDVLTVKNPSVEGQKMHLVEGEKITAGDLLYGLLVYSANDAAEVLAQNYPKGRDAFVQAMNTKAKEYNLEHSSFKNPSGLDNSGQVTTARDLERIAYIAMQNPTFSKIVSTKQKTVKSVDQRYVHKLTNINELLGKVEGVLGVKTGWTENARENLVTYVNRGDRRLMIVLLASQDRFGETEELIDWIYSNYAWIKVNPEG